MKVSLYVKVQELAHVPNFFSILMLLIQEAFNTMVVQTISNQPNYGR